MDILITISNFLILGLIIANPILLLIVLKKSDIEFYSVYYFFIGILLLGGMAYFSAWWSDKSDHILLEHYGFDFDAMNETERYGKVLPENMERVKRIEISIMGVGYPVKAIFGFIALLPYLLVVYIGYFVVHIGKKLLKKIKIRHNNKIINK